MQMDHFFEIADGFIENARSLFERLLESFLSAGNYIQKTWDWCAENASLLLSFLAEKHKVFIDKHYNFVQLADLDQTNKVSFVLFFCVLLALIVLGAKAGRKISNKPKTEITFEDIANAAASHAGNETAFSKPAEQNSSEVVNERSAPANQHGIQQGNNLRNEKGFRFYKKTKRGSGLPAERSTIEDDKFLLGIEQEMLATRQLYLDGFITKDVYISETKNLFEKAQNRMT